MTEHESPVVQTSVTISIAPCSQAQSPQSHRRTLDRVPSPQVTEHGVASRYVQTAGIVVVVIDCSVDVVVGDSVDDVDGDSVDVVEVVVGNSVDVVVVVVGNPVDAVVVVIGNSVDVVEVVVGNSVDVVIDGHLLFLMIIDWMVTYHF